MANDKDFIVKNAVEVGKDTKVTLGTITSSNIDLSTGNYFNDTLTANTTYTFSNAGAVQSFQLEVTGGTLTTYYSLPDLSYDSVSFSISSQNTEPGFITFKPDGTIMYVGGEVPSASVYQYTLSTAWDLSTASYASKSVSVSSQESNPESAAFSSDGTKMYITGQAGGDYVYQYTLSTAWDLSTASYASKSFYVGTQVTIPRSVTFKTDGTKMYVANQSGNEEVFQYALSTAWDVSTASYENKSFAMKTEDQPGGGITFTSDGTEMYMFGTDVRQLFKYTLSTAWDVSTASYANVSSPNTTSQDANSQYAYIKPDGSKMYMVGSTTDTVYQYSLSSSATYTITWPTSIEWPLGITPFAPANGQTDLYTISTDDGGTTYIGLHTADNLS